ncbi:hypothetical protein LUZ60_012390 [Juncus effusus]|nr:hypothetical protein LUZ60_012390 [Juncus effusus]
MEGRRRRRRRRREEVEMDAMNDRKLRAVFIAFGTKGDVFPIAALAAAFACDQKQYEVSFITHSAHQGLSADLAAKYVNYISISSPPVLSAQQLTNSSNLEVDSVQLNNDKMKFSLQKKKIETEQRKECLSAIENIFGNNLCKKGDFIAINFFALEGWHLAELFQVRCIITAPYLVPYSAPSSFESQFVRDFPLLYKYFQEAPPNTVSWKDITHWMWPLFTETWGFWRNNSLNLSSVPFTDPVTNLPLWHVQVESPLLLYGFSKDIVERPGYWPSNIHICGFWFLPPEWQFSCQKCKAIFSNKLNTNLTQQAYLCDNHSVLEQFLAGPTNSNPNLPIFIGLSSIGSMGFLINPKAFLSVIQKATESTEHRFILFSSEYKPLDASISSLSENNLINSSGCTLLFDDRLLCFNGTVPYSWLFPRCAVVIHHAGSGSTAAALQAGVPQVVCPFLLDQFYWADLVHWTGVAPSPLKKHHLCPDSNDDISITSAARALCDAIKCADSVEMRERAACVAQRISSEDGIGEALKVLREKVVFQGLD